MDLSGLSDEDVKAIASGDMSKVSTDGLKMISNGGASSAPAPSLGSQLGSLAIDAAYAPTTPQAMIPAAKAAGALGKAETDKISEVSPTLGSVARFVVPQNAVDVGLTALAGPMGDLGGAALEKIGGTKLIAGAGDALSNGAKNLISYAESKGIKLSPADVSGSPTLKAIENLLEKTPLGSDAIQNYRNQGIAAIKAMRDTLADKLGTSEDATVLDNIAKDAITSAKNAHDAQANVLYGRVGELAGSDPIEMPRQAQAAAKLLDEQLALDPQRRNPAVIEQVSNVLGIDPEKVTPELVDFIKQNPTAHAVDYANYAGNRQLLGNVLNADQAARAMGSQYSSQEAGAAKLLYKEGEKDLAAFSKAQGGELDQAHTLATDFYKQGRAMFDNKTVKGLMRTNPGGLAKAVFRPDPAASTAIDALKDAAGGESGAAWQALKKQFVEKLIPEVGDKFDPMGFQKILQPYEDAGVLNKIFSDNEIRQFKGLARASQLMASADRLAGTQGSARTNTAIGNMVLAGAAGVGGMVLHGPVGVAVGMTGAVLGPKALAELYLSDTGRKLLLDGLTVPAMSPKAAKVAASITSYLALKNAGGKVAP